MTMKSGKLVKSKIDVITNSSTEVFVLARNKGDNRTWEEILEAIKQHHSLHMVDYSRNYKNPDKHGFVDEYSGDCQEIEVKKKNSAFLELWFDRGFCSLHEYLVENFKEINSYNL